LSIEQKKSSPDPPEKVNVAVVEMSGLGGNVRICGAAGGGLQTTHCETASAGGACSSRIVDEPRSVTSPMPDPSPPKSPATAPATPEMKGKEYGAAMLTFTASPICGPV